MKKTEKTTLSPILLKNHKTLLGVIRVVTSQLGFTRAFSIRVLITRNVVPTVMVVDSDIWVVIKGCFVDALLDR